MNKPKKRLIVCCDGTWQKLASPYPTNVVKIAQGIKPSSGKGISQMVFYDQGVGAESIESNVFTWVNDITNVIGGAFGIGIDNNIQEAYRFLSLNYEESDEIYLFGFSRGAFTVRSLAGLIHCSGGLLSLPNIREAPFAYDLYKDSKLTFKEKEMFRKLPIPFEYKDNVKDINKCRKEALKIYSDRQNLSLEKAKEDTNETEQDLAQKEEKVKKVLKKYGLSKREDGNIRQPVKITLIGCWDTVGSLGIPPGIPFLSDWIWINKKYQFHNIQLSPIIQHALHAVSIDEKRKVFDVTLMERNVNSEEQTLSEVWFPGTHGSVGGGTFKEKGLSNSALQWMVTEIGNLSLGLELDLEKSEDSFDFDHKCPFDNNPGLFGLWGLFRLAVKEREIHPNLFTSIHESAETKLSDDELNPRYCPTNLHKYKEKLKEGMDG